MLFDPPAAFLRPQEQGGVLFLYRHDAGYVALIWWTSELQFNIELVAALTFRPLLLLPQGITALMQRPDHAVGNDSVRC